MISCRFYGLWCDFGFVSEDKSVAFGGLFSWLRGVVFCPVGPSVILLPQSIGASFSIMLFSRWVLCIIAGRI